MPTPPLTHEQMQEALDWIEIHGSGRNTHKALGSKDLPPERTIDHRAQQALIRGLKPSVRKEAPRVYEKQRLGEMHLVIPDVQAKEGVPLEHMEWIGNFIVHKKPNVIIQIGDFADLPSLSTYDRGKREAEGKRYVKDIAAVRRAQELLLKPIQDYNRTATEKYNPRRVITKGNHEFRITREIEENPRFEGRFEESD
jgi:hypothetical protein